MTRVHEARLCQTAQGKGPASRLADEVGDQAGQAVVVEIKDGQAMKVSVS